MDILKKLHNRWTLFWLRFSGYSKIGRVAAALAGWGHRPFYGRVQLSLLHKKGYISPKSVISHSKISLAEHVFIDDGVLIFEDHGDGGVQIGSHVHLHRDACIQTGAGGRLTIADHVHVQPRCQFSAYKGDIFIGPGTEIGPSCAFYPYNHGMDARIPLREQPLETRGGIRLSENVWLGYGVIVLDGVCIEKGAVIGAGSVVTKNIPANAVAAGNPAKVITIRNT